MKAIRPIIEQFFSPPPEEKTKSTNPYVNARKAWSTHTAGLIKSIQLWQFVAMVSLLITVTAVAGLISIGSQSKFIPLVFQQDTQGNTLSVTKADVVKEASIDDYRMAAANFIENMRIVSTDTVLQKRAIYQLYAYLNPSDPALIKVQEFFAGKNKTNPFVRAQHEIVSIDIKSVIQESESTWQVDWEETVRSLDGQLTQKPTLMKALVSLYQQKSADITQDSLLKNPHLLFVRNFNWSKVIKSGVEQ